MFVEVLLFRDLWFFCSSFQNQGRITIKWFVLDKGQCIRSKVISCCITGEVKHWNKKEGVKLLVQGSRLAPLLFLLHLHENGCAHPQSVTSDVPTVT